MSFVLSVARMRGLSMYVASEFAISIALAGWLGHLSWMGSAARGYLRDSLACHIMIHM
jgi:hypothetical protein